jgi:hypothetical protein
MTISACENLSRTPLSRIAPWLRRVLRSQMPPLYRPFIVFRFGRVIEFLRPQVRIPSGYASILNYEAKEKELRTAAYYRAAFGSADSQHGFSLGHGRRQSGCAYREFRQYQPASLWHANADLVDALSLLASTSESKDWQSLPRPVVECIQVQGVRVAKESGCGSTRVWSGRSRRSGISAPGRQTSMQLACSG